MTSKKKESIERKKILMVRIKKESHRQVTFSKRRAGLFKKASELCTLCGAEIGIIVFSPAKKPFSFGHPNVEYVLDRYVSRNNLPVTQTHPSLENAELNLRLTHILSEVEEEKHKCQTMEDMRKARAPRSNINWWESPVEEMNMNQLHEIKYALEELKKTVVSKINTTPFNEVKEDVFGFFDNKLVVPSYMNMMSSNLSNTYNFAYGHGCF